MTSHLALEVNTPAAGELVAGGFDRYTGLARDNDQRSTSHDPLRYPTKSTTKPQREVHPVLDRN